MIKSRQELLAINPAFTQFILDIQHARYKPWPYKQGESVILGDDEDGTVLTKEHADQLNVEGLVRFEQQRDRSPFEKTETLTHVANYQVISPKYDTRSYFADISFLLNNIKDEFNAAHLLVLGDWGTPWFAQDNDYPPVKDALNYLKKYIDADFNGGFVLDEKTVYKFIPHLFWLTRCNASLPYFYIAFPKAKTFISICKYGVLHFEFYSEEEQIKVLRLLDHQGFMEVDRCSDPIEFDHFEGRQLYFGD